MDVQAIITETRQIVQQTDPNNSSATDTTILGWINECVDQLCSLLSTLPKANLSGVTAAATVTISQDLLRLDHASIYDGTTYHPLEKLDFNTFARLYPDYQNQPTGQPSAIIRMTDTSWMLYPAPDATWTGKALTLIGTYKPTTLALTTEVPAISVALHPAIPQYCAWKFFLLLNSPERASGEYGTFDMLRKMHTKTATATNGSLLQFKMRGL